MIGHDELVRMLRGAIRLVRENHEELSRLDSFGGDGDHGTTMLRAMVQIEKAIEETASRESRDLLQAVGWSILGVDGGATGPLLGSFFMAMGQAEHAGGMAALFEAGLAGVRKRTRAQVGDKTMIDALHPAVEAAARGSDIASALRLAAEAAEQGAASTTDLRARFGRAKNMGEKSLGSRDPGAASISLIFRGFLEGWTTPKED